MEKCEIMDQDCADARVIGSLSLCFQFAEKRQPTVLVNDTFIYEIVRDIASFYRGRIKYSQ
jgi:hypothetical protein